jgi:hypothetical protein
MAAALAAGPGAAISHLAAACLHQISRRRGKRIDVIARASGAHSAVSRRTHAGASIRAT